MLSLNSELGDSSGPVQPKVSVTSAPCQLIPWEQVQACSACKHGKIRPDRWNEPVQTTSLAPIQPVSINRLVSNHWRTKWCYTQSVRRSHTHTHTMARCTHILYTWHNNVQESHRGRFGCLLLTSTGLTRGEEEAILMGWDQLASMQLEYSPRIFYLDCVTWYCSRRMHCMNVKVG